MAVAYARIIEHGDDNHVIAVISRLGSTKWGRGKTGSQSTARVLTRRSRPAENILPEEEGPNGEMHNKGDHANDEESADGENNDL